MAEGLITPKITVRLRKAHYCFKQAPQLWHDDVNAFLLSLGFTQSSVYPNQYLCCDAILIARFVDDISIEYPEAATTAVIEVKATLSHNYSSTSLSLVHQFLNVEIYRNEIGNGIHLCQNAYDTMNLRRFSMEHIHSVSTLMDPNLKFDVAKDCGEKKL